MQEFSEAFYYFRPIFITLILGLTLILILSIFPTHIKGINRFVIVGISIVCTLISAISFYMIGIIGDELHFSGDRVSLYMFLIVVGLSILNPIIYTVRVKYKDKKGNLRNTLILLPIVIGVGFLGIAQIPDEDLTFREVELDKANSDVKQFIDQMVNRENGTDNGIYTFHRGRQNTMYVFLSQQFLESGKSFGRVFVTTEGDTVNIYLNETTDNGTENGVDGKLYKFNINKDYEFLKVFKNGEKTHIQVAGA